MRIRIQKIAPKEEACDFIVKARRVVADAYRTRLIEASPDFARKVALGHALFLAELRRQSRYETAVGLRQVVSGGLGIEHVSLTQRIEIHVRAHAGKLRRAVRSTVEPEGFKVVPIKAGVIRHEEVLRRESRRTALGCS